MEHSGRGDGSLQRTGRTNRRYRCALITVLAVVLAVAATVSGAMLTVPDRSVAPNGSVVVPVLIAGARDLGEAELAVEYDPSVLRFRSAVPGSLAGRASVSATETLPGRIAIAVASPRSVTGDGPLVDLTFDAVGAQGSRSALTLTVGRAVTVDGESVPITVANGTVSVGGSALVPLSPLAPVVAFAVASVLIGLAHRRR